MPRQVLVIDCAGLNIGFIELRALWPYIQAAVLEVAEKVGLAKDAIRAAKPKSFVRARNKMDSKDDHRYKPKPRPAYNIDLMRCLAMAMTPGVKTDDVNKLGSSGSEKKPVADAILTTLSALPVTAVHATPFEPGRTFN